MARPLKENRNEVASVPFNIRITEAEKRAIERLVLHQEEQLRGMGIVAKASAASLVRTWIHTETKRAFGAFPLADEPQPDLPLELEVPKPKPLDTAEVLAAARKLADPQAGLLYVPDLVHALAPHPVEGIKAALLEASSVLELRPESGIETLSKADAALCPRGAKGVVLSYARIIDEPKSKAPANDGAPPPAINADKLRARVEKALAGKSKRFDTAAELAREAGVTATELSNLRHKRTVSAGKLAAIEAALTGRGA